MDDHLGNYPATIDFVSAKIRQQYRTFVTDFIWHAAAGKNAATISLHILDVQGREVETPMKNENVQGGSHEVNVEVSGLNNGIYFAILERNGETAQHIKFMVSK